MQPAARVGDRHTCEMADPDGVPHVGGPIEGPGAATVFIGGFRAAVRGDTCLCTGDGSMDTILGGSQTVFIEGRLAARRGDITAHGGAIDGGDPTVLIG